MFKAGKINDILLAVISDLFSSPLTFLFTFVALVVGITIHEFSHAFVADRLGDPTARLAKRVTLNPLAHLDPLGTLILVFLGFGWGKPVPFDPFNLKNPKTDSALISVAGPLSNLILATLASLILHLVAFVFVGPLAMIIQALLIAIIRLNIVLAVFNVLPIHPLDGFKIVGGLLPDDRAAEWSELSHYGMVFLFLLLVPWGGRSILSGILYPVVFFVSSLLIPPAVFLP